jgi:mRNA interferase MazF
VQGELGENLPTVVVCPLTSGVRDDLPRFRISIAPELQNGLLQASQVMIDKPAVVQRGKLHAPIGRLSDDQVANISAALAALLGLA